MRILGDEYTWSEIGQIIASLATVALIFFSLLGGFFYELKLLGLMK